MATFLLLASACSSVNNGRVEQMQIEIPVYVQAMEPVEEKISYNRGSLFNRGKKPLFGDRKARRVNDLITIVISETSTSSTKASKSLDDTSNHALGGGLIGASNKELPSSLSNLLSSLNNLSNIKLDSSSKSSFSGKGSNVRDDRFSTQITARITKAMRNNTYYIVGKRELLINGEHQFVSISGLIRADDISANNVINSKYISDAKIYYDTKGSVAISNNVSWGTKMLKAIWPF